MEANPNEKRKWDDELDTSFEEEPSIIENMPHLHKRTKSSVTIADRTSLRRERKVPQKYKDALSQIIPKKKWKKPCNLEVTMHKKRGRKPKVKDVPALNHQNVMEKITQAVEKVNCRYKVSKPKFEESIVPRVGECAVKRKRGRPRKEDVVRRELSVSIKLPKKRGRKPKRKNMLNAARKSAVQAVSTESSMDMVARLNARLDQQSRSEIGVDSSLLCQYDPSQYELEDLIKMDMNCGHGEDAQINENLLSDLAVNSAFDGLERDLMSISSPTPIDIEKSEEIMELVDTVIDRLDSDAKNDEGFDFVTISKETAIQSALRIAVGYVPTSNKQFLTELLQSEIKGSSELNIPSESPSSNEDEKQKESTADESNKDVIKTADCLNSDSNGRESEPIVQGEGTGTSVRTNKILNVRGQEHSKLSKSDAFMGGWRGTYRPESCESVCKVEKIGPGHLLIDSVRYMRVNLENYVREEDVELRVEEDRTSNSDQELPLTVFNQKCKVSSCRLGCVCDSLNTPISESRQLHCDKFKCCLECTCLEGRKLCWENEYNKDIRARLRPRISLMAWKNRFSDNKEEPENVEPTDGKTRRSARLAGPAGNGRMSSYEAKRKKEAQMRKSVAANAIRKRAATRKASGGYGKQPVLLMKSRRLLANTRRCRGRPKKKGRVEPSRPAALSEGDDTGLTQVLIQRPDGSGQLIVPPTGKKLMLKKPDGSKMLIYPDGMRIIRKPDGTRYVHKPPVMNPSVPLRYILKTETPGQRCEMVDDDSRDMKVAVSDNSENLKVRRGFGAVKTYPGPSFLKKKQSTGQNDCSKRSRSVNNNLSVHEKENNLSGDGPNPEPIELGLDTERSAVTKSHSYKSLNSCGPTLRSVKSVKRPVLASNHNSSTSGLSNEKIKKLIEAGKYKLIKPATMIRTLKASGGTSLIKKEHIMLDVDNGEQDVNETEEEELETRRYVKKPYSRRKKPEELANGAEKVCLLVKAVTKKESFSDLSLLTISDNQSIALCWTAKLKIPKACIYEKYPCTPFLYLPTPRDSDEVCWLFYSLPSNFVESEVVFISQLQCYVSTAKLLKLFTLSLKNSCDLNIKMNFKAIADKNATPYTSNLFILEKIPKCLVIGPMPKQEISYSIESTPDMNILKMFHCLEKGSGKHKRYTGVLTPQLYQKITAGKQKYYAKST